LVCFHLPCTWSQFIAASLRILLQMDGLVHSAERTNGRKKSSHRRGLRPKGEKPQLWRSFQLRKERSKELAKHKNTSEVMESQSSYTDGRCPEMGLPGAVLALGKFARLRFFSSSHDIWASEEISNGMGIGDKKAIRETAEI